MFRKNISYKLQKVARVRKLALVFSLTTGQFCSLMLGLCVHLNSSSFHLNWSKVRCHSVDGSTSYSIQGLARLRKDFTTTNSAFPYIMQYSFVPHDISLKQPNYITSISSGGV